jgi:hypothetical protein
MTDCRLFRIILILGLLIAVTAMIGDVSLASDNAQAAADFLNIGVGARAAAMGGAYTSIAEDALSAFWNPAGLSSVNSVQVALSHFSWYQDLNYEYLAVAYPLQDKLTIAASASYLSYGSIDGYDQYDNPTGELNSTYDLAAGLSAGYLVRENLSLGLTAKYVVLSLDGYNASALAADIGAQYNIGNVKLGLAVVNLGQDVKFGETSEKLPIGIRAGASIRPFHPSLLTTLELENQFYGNFTIKNGYEFCYLERYFARIGYAYYPGQDDRVFGQSLSFGVGAYLGLAQFDYTFSPQERYSSEAIHRFSIIFGI